MKKELLMSWSKYYGTKWPSPYTYVLEKEGFYLYYFGSKHCYNLEDEQFGIIEKFWDEFIEKTSTQDKIVLLEGGNRPALATKEEAILKGGEMNFVAYLAKQKEVKTFSPEPSRKIVFEKMSEHFSREEIEYYFFAQIVYQWNNSNKREDFEIYMGPFLKNDEISSGWTDFEFSIDHMKTIHKQIFNKDFDQNDKDFFHNAINPTKDETIINKVSRFADDGFRDNHIMSEIERFWNDKKSIFIIYGRSHAIRQEAVLRDLIG